ncbi:hypothetical protein WR25_24050 [Diploscapter pachys]|uniref:RRM domain-containing protein n=1 Tax=Diploscapter pachys TaxID=2018661 RepID=A0A2A2JV10_9BILA|nr:hypothetical protein WR25_24050 [Diploscapter pachys]
MEAKLERGIQIHGVRNTESEETFRKFFQENFSDVSIEELNFATYPENGKPAGFIQLYLSRQEDAQRIVSMGKINISGKMRKLKKIPKNTQEKEKPADAAPTPSDQEGLSKTEPLPILESSYEKAKDFSRVLSKLLNAERGEQRRQAENSKTTLKTVAFHRNEKKEIVIQFRLPTVENQHSAEISKIRVGQGDLVSFTSLSGRGWRKTGFIIRRPDTLVDFYEALLKSTNDEKIPDLEASQIQFKILHNDISFERQFSALKRFGVFDDFPEQNCCITQTLLGRSLNHSAFEIERTRPILFKINGLQDFNRQQKDAITIALTHSISAIEGPPGTGKTSVGAGLIKNWHMELGTQDFILVCAPSNVSADECALRAEKTGLKPVRVFAQSMEMVEDRASHLSLHEMVAKSASSELRYLLDLKSKRILNPKEAATLRTLELCTQLRILRKSRIAVTTCSSAAMECIKEMVPTHLLLDEAGMCSIPEALVPLMSGVKRFIMIGDVQQLPPLILSPRARRCGLAISVMERAIANRVPGSVLKPQHRMHPSISAFSNSEFYEDQLVDAVDAEELERMTAKWNWRPGQRKAFLECREPETRCGDSFINVSQAVQIVDLAEEFIEIGLKPEDVAIITFYRAQTELVQHIIRQRNYSDGGKLEGLEVKNVDGFQSQEKGVILLSTVRANERGNCGFLKDFRRVNVALTRAKSGLLIIGSSETLAADRVLNSMLRHYQSDGTIYGGCAGHLRSIEIDIGEPKVYFLKNSQIHL